MSLAGRPHPPRPAAGRPAAVIGAGGFLGRPLVAALRMAGVPVAEFTRTIPFLGPAGEPAAGLAAARTAYWLATSVNPLVAEQEPDRVAADREVFAGFLAALGRLADPPTVVLLSSGGTVYDAEAPPPYAEDAPTRPRSAYGRAKLDLERVLAGSDPVAGRRVAVRVSNAYGPGQPAVRGQGVVAHWLAAAARGEHIRIFGDPATTRDYVYVGDVAEALVRVHAGGAPLPSVVNVGSGRPTSLRALAETVLSVVGNFSLELEVEPRRSFDVPHTWLEVTRAREVLGWRARTPLSAGVAAAWAAHRGAAVPGGVPG